MNQEENKRIGIPCNALPGIWLPSRIERLKGEKIKNQIENMNNKLVLKFRFLKNINRLDKTKMAIVVKIIHPPKMLVPTIILREYLRIS